MRVVNGDLFEYPAKAIGHGVNTRGVMGAGIATVFKKLWPEMYAEYRTLCQSGKLVAGGFFPWQDPVSGKWVYNLASQDLPGPDARIEWLATAAHSALTHARDNDVIEIALPAIGCGIGGLELEDVKTCLTQVERNYPGYFTIVLL